MTKRQHTPPRGQDSVQAKGLRREAFPALRAFLRGYLHQDYAAVHGSMRAAADAFRADASADAGGDVPDLRSRRIGEAIRV